jgi:transketolase
VIGFGSPNKEGTQKAHGAALGEDEVKLAREKLGWPYPAFEIPAEIYAAWDARAKGAERSKAWNQLLEKYAAQYPAEAADLKRRISGELPEAWAQGIADVLEKSAAAEKPMATRKSSEAILNAIGPMLPELVGGSADLTESNNTQWHAAKVLTPGDVVGNYVEYGVREFGMACAVNGMALHGGLVPFGATFLVFSDYCRNALRLSALMRIRSIFVFTHDSIGLGEDGPTHQPVEHIASLRLIPHLHVWRPADAFETAVSWKAALERSDGPSILALSRQNLAPQPHAADHAALAERGGYVLFEPSSAPVAVVIATGSEVDLAMQAAKKLGDEGKAVRVVSMPCVDVFEEQDKAYQDSVLPPALTLRLSVEAGVTSGWHGVVGLSGAMLGVDRFGDSAPAPQVFAEFGLTVDGVAAKLRELLS